MMIDEFTDVNEGEKEVMKMWNMHCMKHNYIADSQIPNCCMKFVSERGRELVSRGLYHNFLLHLVNLYDFSLLHPQFISHIMSQLDKVKDEVEKEANIPGTSGISDRLANIPAVSGASAPSPSPSPVVKTERSPSTEENR